MTKRDARRTLPSERGGVDTANFLIGKLLIYQTSYSRTRRPNPLLGCAVTFVALLGGLILGLSTLGITMDHVAPGSLTLSSGSVSDKLTAIEAVVAAQVGEKPHVKPQQPEGALPLCTGVPAVYDHAFRVAFGLMRATDEGRRLYAELQQYDVCVVVSDLSYNSAYSQSRMVSGQWVSGSIVIDRRYVHAIEADVLAAILVHESTHIDRAISGTACFSNESTESAAKCETLSNGVRIVEEVAAHTAEAEWWIAVYGDNGKRFAMNTAISENSLVEAYRNGTKALHNYVVAGRSDPREGQGF